MKKKHLTFSYQNFILSIIGALLSFFAVLYLTYFHGMDTFYNYEYPNYHTFSEVSASHSAEYMGLFECSYLSEIALYIDVLPTEESELTIQLMYSEQEEIISSVSVSSKSLDRNKWIKIPIHQKVEPNAVYHLLITSANGVTYLDAALGYRDSLHTLLSTFIIIIVIFIGLLFSILPYFCFPSNIIKEWKSDTNKPHHAMHHVQIPLMIIFLIFTLASCYIHHLKQGYYIDEYLTYSLANVDISATELPDGIKCLSPSAFIEKLLTINETNSAFHYSNVWENQRIDTHPPLYYVLIHTICSFFPNTFNKWIAFIINLPFAWLTILLFYKLISMLIPSDKQAPTILTFLFCMNPAYLKMTSFLRMYIMAAFFVVLLSYWIVKYRNAHNLRFLVGCTFITVLGTLTHYYYLVYAFFTFLLLGILYLKKKKYTYLSRLLYTLILSGVIIISIFPWILCHILGGARGTENIHNILRISNYFPRLLSMLFHMTLDLLPGPMILLFPLSFWGFLKKRKSIKKIFLFAIPAVLYFVLVSIIASFVDTRYLYPIYPLLVLLLYLGCYYALQASSQLSVTLKKSIIFVLMLLVTIASYKHYNWEYHYIERNKERIELLENYSGSDCIIICDEGWRIFEPYLELDSFSSTTFVWDRSIDRLDARQYTNDYSIVLISSGLDSSYLDKVLELLPQYHEYDILEDVYDLYKIVQIY